MTTPFTLAQIQSVFGREIAGNHTVLAIDEDGWAICRCEVEIDGTTGVVWFSMNETPGDWDVMSETDARAEVARLRRAATRTR